MQTEKIRITEDRSFQNTKLLVWPENPPPGLFLSSHKSDKLLPPSTGQDSIVFFRPPKLETLWLALTHLLHCLTQKPHSSHVFFLPSLVTYTNCIHSISSNCIQLKFRMFNLCMYAEGTKNIDKLTTLQSSNSNIQL